MKRTVGVIAAALMMVGASAGMASAAANDYGSQPGYAGAIANSNGCCLLYTSPSPRDS